MEAERPRRRVDGGLLGHHRRATKTGSARIEDDEEIKEPESSPEMPIADTRTDFGTQAGLPQSA